jgi:hypothetical protein
VEAAVLLDAADAGIVIADVAKAGRLGGAAIEG